MPSFTSSSNDRIPAIHYGKVWLAALLAAALVVLTVEGFWRELGFRPTRTDNAQCWGDKRAAASRAGSEVVALVGASRMQAAIDLVTFRHETHMRPIQLAVPAGDSVPVLRDLANDSSFEGNVICSIIADWITATRSVVHVPADKMGITEDWIAAYHNRTPADEIDGYLSGFVLDSFVFRSPELSFSMLYRGGLLRGKIPKASQSFREIHADRSVLLDFSKQDAQYFKRQIEKDIQSYASRKDPPSADMVLSKVALIRDMVVRLQNRGCKVIFVRFPTTGNRWKLDNGYFSKEKYWDVFARNVNARCFHFKDYPALAAFSCPDGSHLDRKDREAFTRALISIIHDELVSEVVVKFNM